MARERLEDSRGSRALALELELPADPLARREVPGWSAHQTVDPAADKGPVRIDERIS
jgi:hypothetical protein